MRFVLVNSVVMRWLLQDGSDARLGDARHVAAVLAEGHHQSVLGWVGDPDGVDIVLGLAARREAGGWPGHGMHPPAAIHLPRTANPLAIADDSLAAVRAQVERVNGPAAQEAWAALRKRLDALSNPPPAE